MGTKEKMVRGEQMQAMFALQEQLNDQTNGKAWRQGVTKNGKVIHWRRCIVMEVAELIDSFPWKHWKGIAAGLDWENIRIEVVDIWHFVMSELLRLEPMEQACERALACQTKEVFALPSVWSEEENGRLNDYLAPFERLMAMALEVHEDAAWRSGMVTQFFLCAQSVGLDLDGLYRLYIGKNALNQFRQQHGYKEGTYQKVWGTQEDNAVLQAILSQTPTIGYTALMERLEEAYAQR